MKRKVIQICNAETEDGSRLVALCDDGTIWKMYNDDDCWCWVKDIPQDEE